MLNTLCRWTAAAGERASGQAAAPAVRRARRYAFQCGWVHQHGCARAAGEGGEVADAAATGLQLAATCLRVVICGSGMYAVYRGS